MDRVQLKSCCKTRRICWGTVVLEYTVPHTVRTFAQAGYEWLWLDLEHNAIGIETVLELVRTAQDVGIATIVRVPQAEYAHIARTLDTGVDGIMVPRVETPEQMRTSWIVAKFPPVGSVDSAYAPPRSENTPCPRERSPTRTIRAWCVSNWRAPGGCQCRGDLDAAGGQLVPSLWAPRIFR